MTGRRHAFIVGAERYDDPGYGDTSFCHADASLMHKTLTEDCDYDPAVTRILRCVPGDGTTPGSLVRELKKMVQLTRSGDTFLFFFAGHGDVSGEDGYLVLPSTRETDLANTGIPLQEISDALRERELFCFRVFDCCHSGHDVRRPGERGGSAFLHRALRGSSPRGWATLAACGPDEGSYPDVAAGQGVFTARLVRAIKSVPAGQPVLPEVIKIKACAEVEAWAQSKGVLQTPTMNSSLSGNVSIATRKSAPAAPRGNATSRDKGRRPLAARINAVRGIPKVSAAKQPELDAWLDDLAALLLESCQQADWPGAGEPELLGPSGAGSVPDHVLEMLVPHLRSLKLGLQHSYSSTPIRAYDPFEGAFGRMLNSSLSLFSQLNKPKILRVDHSIDTNEFDHCFASVDLESGDLFPELCLFVYVVPAKLAYVVAAGASLRVDQDASYQEVALGSIVARPRAKPTHEAEELVRRTVEAARERFIRQVVLNVEALEREVTEAGLDDAPDE